MVASKELSEFMSVVLGIDVEDLAEAEFDMEYERALELATPEDMEILRG